MFVQFKSNDSDWKIWHHHIHRSLRQVHSCFNIEKEWKLGNSRIVISFSMTMTDPKLHLKDDGVINIFHRSFTTRSLELTYFSSINSYFRLHRIIMIGNEMRFLSSENQYYSWICLLIYYSISSFCLPFYFFLTKVLVINFITSSYGASQWG